MKKLLSLILAIAIMVCVIPFGAFTLTASAATSGTTGDCNWTLDGTTLTISGKGNMENYLDDSPYDYAPWGTKITKVVIKDGVKHIGSSAFANCSKIISITIPDSLTKISYDDFIDTAYYNDESNWENGVLYIGKHLIKAKNDVSGSCAIKSGTKVIADRAFYRCSSLTGIIIPKSVVSIGDYAFSECTKLKSILMPDTVANIGISAFWWTAYYNDESNWENGVLYIGKHLIKAKDDVSGSCTIKSGTKIIAHSAFYGCSSLASVIIPIVLQK